MIAYFKNFFNRFTGNDTQESTQKIVILLNPMIYFLDWVIILYEDPGFRLLVNHRGKNLTDERFPELDEAKLHFITSYRNRIADPKHSPLWSHEFHPLKQWLDERLGRKKTSYRSSYRDNLKRLPLTPAQHKSG